MIVDNYENLEIMWCKQVIGAGKRGWVRDSLEAAGVGRMNWEKWNICLISM